MKTNQDLRSWFFTNEMLAGFLAGLPEQEKIKNVFGIAGSGDFAFNLLSQTNKIEQMILCDLREKSCLTVRLKRLFFSELSWSEAQDFLFDKKIVKKFKKAKFWYGDSFLSPTSFNKYLAYFSSNESFQALRSQLAKIKVCPGDFLQVIKNFPDGFFDLIYVSDIFDAKNYFQPSNEETILIKNKLSPHGQLLVVAQDTEKEIIKKAGQAGFILKASEIHHFNFWRSFWQYDYSFLLFTKNSKN